MAGHGELNASVRGTIADELNLDQWSASQPPDDEPVKGKGNSECWGDEPAGIFPVGRLPRIS